VEALEAAKGLLGCWRTGEANEPAIFIAAIAAVLQMYSHEVVQHICDPRCGMPFTNKWPPTSPHEVREACDLRADIIFGHEEMARREENERRRDQGVAVALPPPEVIKPTLEEMEARHGKGWGIETGPVPSDWQYREFCKTLPVGSKWTRAQIIEKWRERGATAEDVGPAGENFKAMQGDDLVRHYAEHGLNFGNPVEHNLTREPAQPVAPILDAVGVELDQGADF
jgi:hypothetical protein